MSAHPLPQAERQPPRERFEHCCFWIAEHDLENRMNVMGRDGWEFCGAVGSTEWRERQQGWRCAFKRRAG